MTRKLLATIFVICNLASGLMVSYAAEPIAPQQCIKLSTELQNLLRAEMREITKGVQGIAVSLATADWQSIQETSTKIRTSYIMEKQLTVAQAKELEQALPERFKQLDASFINGQSGSALRLQPMIPSWWLSIIPTWWKAVPAVTRLMPNRAFPDSHPQPSRAIITKRTQ